MAHNGMHTVAQGSCDGGATVAGLAAERGCSKDTIRRAIKSGTLPAHRVGTRHGPSWCVHPDGQLRPSHNGVHTVVPTVAQGSHDGAFPHAEDQTAEAEHLAALVRELTAENRQLAETAAVLAERCRVLTDQLALGAPESAVAGQETVLGPTTTPEPSTWLSWPLSRPIMLAVLAAVLAAGILLLVPR